MRHQIRRQLRQHRAFYGIGLLVCLLLAGITSFYASSAPDGLEKVAAEKGFEDTAKDHTLAGWPLAGYNTHGIGDMRLSGGLAGTVGVGLTLMLAGGLFFLLARRQEVAARGATRPATPADVTHPILEVTDAHPIPEVTDATPAGPMPTASEAGPPPSREV